MIVEKPHAVCIPFPSQGHVNPIMQLAKLLHSRGIHITFVNTEFNQRRLIQSKGPDDAIEGLTDFRFETIPDGLPLSIHDATQDVPSLCTSVQKNCLGPLLDLLMKLNSSSDLPPVSCVVYDSMMSCGLQAAKELGIQAIEFWSAAACSFMVYLHFPELIKRRIVPLTGSSLSLLSHLLCKLLENMVVEKPHAVCIPFPSQGHVNPIMQLAKLLHSRGTYITFVNTEFNQRRLIQSKSPDDAIEGLTDFRFEMIPDGLPLSIRDATQDVPSLCTSVQNNCLGPLLDLLMKLNSSSDLPPVSCVVYDSMMTCGLQAAEELGIQAIEFWPAAACSFMGYLHVPELIKRRIVPLKDENDISNGYLDTTIDWIPGMKHIQLKDLPTFVRTTDPSDIVLNFFIEGSTKWLKASAIIFNTFDELEQEVLDALACKFPCIYTMGPLSILGRDLPQSDSKLMPSSLWKVEMECLRWLDKMEPNSVLYVNFGSIAVMTDQHLREFAWGLANSKHPFLWVIRPDLVMGESAILPQEFIEETKDRSFLASWCPQEQVLLHSSIGGFLTHCGWNSIIESICGGVPMLCWPPFADQPMNCRYASTIWEIGMEIDKDVKRDEIERLVKELLEGEKGRKMRNKALEWKVKAEGATKLGGSSYNNFDRLLSEILQPKESPTQ